MPTNRLTIAHNLLYNICMNKSFNSFKIKGKETVHKHKLEGSDNNLQQERANLCPGAKKLLQAGHPGPVV